MKKIVVYILASLLLLGLVGCADEGISAPDLLEPVGVKSDTAVAERGEIYEATVYKGEVVPHVEALSFAVDGQLGEVSVRLGDTVQKGQVLVALDNEKLKEQIENLEAEIAHIQKTAGFSDHLAELDIAIAEEQLKSLRLNGADANACREKELEIQQLKLDLKQSQELRDLETTYKKEKLETLKKQLGNAVITAPVSGQIVYLTPAEAGTTIKAYTTVICIADTQQLRVSTEYIPAKTIEASTRIYARILDADIPLKYVPMDSAEYASGVLAGEQIKSEFIMETDDDRIQSGQFAAVMLISSYKSDALTIPANAVYRDEKGWYVYKKEGTDHIRCNITVGIMNDAKVEIIDGLQEGDAVYVKE
jgi:RND family efflux transporter MFP subunit